MNNKRTITWTSIAVIIFAPGLISLVTKPEARTFQGVTLEETRYTEITFPNSEQNINLGGLLFVPEGDDPFPAVVIIHGSGTSRRNSGWYLTLTQYLQENGIVVLLPDKRGSEKSTGDWRTASFDDLATDALAAVQFLKEQDRVAISSLGVIGMSQGGWIAPIVASNSSDVSFLVNVVGTSLSTYDQLLFEENHNIREMGILPGLSNLIARLSSASIRNSRQKDFWDAIGNFDPISYWEKMAIPSLTLYGEKDTNVPSAASAARLRNLSNPLIEVRVYTGSGHALESPKGEGNSIFREDAMRDIRDFIFTALSKP